MSFILVLLVLFGIKHFVCDFWLQTNSMIQDKGTYLGFGGIQHSFHHAVGTFLVLLIALPWNLEVLLASIMIGCLDGVVHYHIDWVKTNLSQGTTPADKKFWILLGADQGLHYLTYVGIIAILVLL